MVVAETFFSSEHHPKHHVADRLVKDAVCYRDVPSAVCDLSVTEVGKDSQVTLLSQVFPSKFAVFALSYKCWENNYDLFFKMILSSLSLDKWWKLLAAAIIFLKELCRAPENF